MTQATSEIVRPVQNDETLGDRSQPSTSYVPGGVDLTLSHDGLSFAQYMLAGSIAGVVEHMAMFPVDTVKTRMQAIAPAGQAPRHPSVANALSTILKGEGVAGLYRGIAAMGIGAAPAHAVYFSVYELAKARLGGNQKGHHPLAHGAAGAIATVASDAVLNPMDVVKQRLQLRRSPYKGVLDCVSRILKEEGFHALYASYRTTLVMNVPFTAVHFSTYEAAKTVLKGVDSVSGDDESLLTHLLAGGSAGALASAVTNPLDVVKTRLQCQGVCGAEKFKSGSIKVVLEKLIREEGVRVLLRGIRPRVMFHTPAAAICWSSYEAGKSFLQGWNADRA